MKIISVIGEKANVSDTGKLIYKDSAAVLKNHPSHSTAESFTTIYYPASSKNSVENVNSSWFSTPFQLWSDVNDTGHIALYPLYPHKSGNQNEQAVR